MTASRIRLVFRLTWLTMLWLTLIFLSARYAMFGQFTTPAALADYAHDVQRMWFIGVRYDLRIAGIALAPLLLSGLMLASWQAGWQWWRRCAPFFIGLVSLIAVATAIGNFYYYQTYHQHFNVFAFGLFEDDTQAVLANIHQDYPVIAASLVALLFALIPGLLAYWQLRTPKVMRPWPWPALSG